MQGDRNLAISQCLSTALEHITATWVTSCPREQPEGQLAYSIITPVLPEGKYRCSVKGVVRISEESTTVSTSAVLSPSCQRR